MLLWYLTSDSTFYQEAKDVECEVRTETHRGMQRQVKGFQPEQEPCKKQTHDPKAFPYLVPVSQDNLYNDRWTVKRWTAQADLDTRRQYRTRRTILVAYVDYLKHDLHMDDYVLDKVSAYFESELTRKVWNNAVQAADILPVMMGGEMMYA